MENAKAREQAEAEDALAKKIANRKKNSKFTTMTVFQYILETSAISDALSLTAIFDALDTTCICVASITF